MFRMTSCTEQQILLKFEYINMLEMLIDMWRCEVCQIKWYKIKHHVLNDISHSHHRFGIYKEMKLGTCFQTLWMCVIG
jgi:uncharacterized LabA/DUF88 family protein